MRWQGNHGQTRIEWPYSADITLYRDSAPSAPASGVTTTSTTSSTTSTTTSTTTTSTTTTSTTTPAPVVECGPDIVSTESYTVFGTGAVWTGGLYVPPNYWVEVTASGYITTPTATASVEGIYSSEWGGTAVPILPDLNYIEQDFDQSIKNYFSQNTNPRSLTCAITQTNNAPGINLFNGIQGERSMLISPELIGKDGGYLWFVFNDEIGNHASNSLSYDVQVDQYYPCSGIVTTTTTTTSTTTTSTTTTSTTSTSTTTPAPPVSGVPGCEEIGISSSFVASGLTYNAALYPYVSVVGYDFFDETLASSCTINITGFYSDTTTEILTFVVSSGVGDGYYPVPPSSIDYSSVSDVRLLNKSGKTFSRIEGSCTWAGETPSNNGFYAESVVSLCFSTNPTIIPIEEEISAP